MKTKLVKTKFKATIRAACHSFGGAVCAGAVMLIASSTLAQNLFVTDFGGHIYELTPGGVQSTFASGLSQAGGLAFDSAGNLFVSDSGSGNIYEYTPDGTRSTFASVSAPNAMAFDSAGNLFVACDGPGYIYEFTPGGVQSTFASGLNWPDGLAFDSAGNLFVADSSNDIIYKFTPGGVRSTFASGTGGPAGLAFNSAGNLFVADYWSGNIYEFTPGGVRSTFASGLGVGGPNSLAFNSAGNLFESNGGSGNVYEYTPDGTRSTFASGLSNAAGLAFQPVTSAPTCPNIVGTWTGQVNVAVAPSGGFHATTLSLQVTGRSTNGCLLRGYLNTGNVSGKTPWGCFNPGSLWGKVPFTGTILGTTGVILNFGIFGQASATLDMSQTPPVMKNFILLSTGGAANGDTAVGDLTQQPSGP
jgi:sugar lactone lactonase YvrE